MKSIYKEFSANYPRLKTDCFFSDYRNTYRYTGCADYANRFAESVQLLDGGLWSRFVQQFKESADDKDRGWRCEFWGKMMRGAAFVYSYTRNKDLYNILTRTVEDILSAEDEYGRISTYSRDCELDGWDMWGRKYVLLGMQYFMEICADRELCGRVINSMVRQADYIIDRVGDGEGKIPICDTARNWRGLPSSSILEPIVRLYSVTREKRFLDFAKYIVENGGCDVINIFDLAYENELAPWQYSVTKAYEMTSCFEGLLEYFRVTGIEKYKTAVINFADKILQNDFTVIGGCGCTSEYFDHSSVRQANTTNPEIMQETCVTVTLMKFFWQLNLLTGDAKYADAFEKSFYNAYLGSLNTENAVGRSVMYDKFKDIFKDVMPYDSYNPLTNGTRGSEIGGWRVMSDNHYYGCCACIGSLGAGLVPKMNLLTTEDGFVMNMYINGEVTALFPDCGKLTFKTETEYPADGKINITLSIENPLFFELKLRNPEWSKTTSVFVCGEETVVSNGYISIAREWKNNDSVEINLDMRTQVIKPVPYGEQVLINRPIWGKNYMVTAYDREDPLAKKHIALRRGPIMLAQDSRLGYDLSVPAEVLINDGGYTDAFVTKGIAPYESIVEVQVPLKSGEKAVLTDYASAGKLWSDNSKIGVWILNEK